MVKSKESRSKRRPAIGWREWVQLPDLNVPAIKAKVDTGARSSALHAFDVAIEGDVPKREVSFIVHPFQGGSGQAIACRAALLEQRWVKSSNGVRELRPVIRTRLGLMGDTWDIDLTLTSRDAMGFRMLLGREAIRGRFLVNPGKSFRAKAFLPS
ncbi:MAG: ATP-dependent zinc protease [Myxococcota bacterium]